MELKNRVYTDVIDFKQKFFEIDKNTKNSKGFLYEFNFKSANDSLTKENVDGYIRNFGNFSEFVKGKKFIIHLTGLMSDNEQTSLVFFKLVVGLTVRRTLSEVEEEVNRANSEFFTENNITLLNKRIVKNRSKVSPEIYIDCLNEYIEKEYPLYFKKQEIFY